jgi:hypothetical protein
MCNKGVVKINTTIIFRIKKLLALRVKAQGLLEKHKLLLREVEECNDLKINVIENKTNITFTKAKWNGRLAYGIAENLGCYSFFRTNRTHAIIFMGRDEDVTVCTIALEYAVDCINSIVKKLRYEYSKIDYKISILPHTIKDDF